MISVTLSPAEEMHAARVALTRTQECRQLGVKENIKDITYFQNIYNQSEAIGAEIAAAKALGVDQFDASMSKWKQTADIGRNIEVRWSHWESAHAICKPTDRDDDLILLVTGRSPEYRVVGYIPVIAARKPRFLHKSGYWWVSQINLRPVETLARSVYANATL
jgi:hypothetical protein